MKRTIFTMMLVLAGIGSAKATTIAIKQPENLTQAKINPASIVSILESNLVNLPNITLADRNNQHEIDQEFAFQHTGKVSQESMQSAGEMAGAKFLVIPKITYARATDRSVHFSNFTEHKANLELELQIKMLDVSKGTLVYSKNFDVTHTYASGSSSYWTALVRKAAGKLVGDETFQYKIGAVKPKAEVKMDKVTFQVAPDAMVLVNGSYVSTGNGFGSFKDGVTIDVKVVRDGYKNWHYPVKVSPNMIIKAVNEKNEKSAEPKPASKMKTVQKVTMTVQQPK
ncbi:hypothetical protein [Dongshaea marina]|uniref:hypothetical protein n=1 Tax=Dongshaea marina TaxID=2047966 RepID=UPI00131F1BD4|nr:hypothetical protein [Dongshaea marina]